MNAKNFIHAWHENFLTGNHDFLDEILDESVVFHSPVVFKPLPGKDMTKMYLIAAGFSFNLEKFKLKIVRNCIIFFIHLNYYIHNFFLSIFFSLSIILVVKLTLSL